MSNRNRSLRWLGLGAAFALYNVVGCSASGSDGLGDANAGGAAGASASAGSGGTAASGIGGSAGSSGSAGIAGSAGSSNQTPKAHLKGKVLAPEGTIPIPGALVYLTTTAPDAIPDHVYCDTCVTLSASIPFTRSNPDGTFDLPTPEIGDFFLVVQKGQFRRVRSYSVVAGDQNLDAALTTLPGKMDKANGDDIPKMALITGAWDAIEVSLAKLGLAELNDGGLFGPKTKNESFDKIEDFSGPKSPYEFLKSYDLMSQYHIVFKPCSGSDGTTCNDFQPDNSNVQGAVRDFVKAGGKFYATDYSYEYIRRTWPGYIDWETDPSKSGTGEACLNGQADAPVTDMDPGLEAWLAAQNITSVTLKANWTAINQVNTMTGLDANLMPAQVTPKVWVTGNFGGFGNKPATTSFVHGCGRALFSTYHTEGGAGDALLPQERALLYVLLQVGVCVKPDDPNDTQIQ